MEARDAKGPFAERQRIGWRDVLPYIETLAIVIIIAAIQFEANYLMEERARYSLMLIGTCYGTWRGGKAAGIFALLLSALIGAYFLTPQRFSLVVQDIIDSITLTLYLVVGAVIILFGEAQRRERRRALDGENNLRIAHEELAKANAQLEELLQKRVEELSEIKRYVAEEELPSNFSHHNRSISIFDALIESSNSGTESQPVIDEPSPDEDQKSTN